MSEAKYKRVNEIPFDSDRKLMTTVNNIEDKIIEFSVSSATVELAAKALGTEKGRIAKSMSFDLGDKCIVVVMTGDVKTDNAKFKAEFKVKAKMTPFLEVEEKREEKF